MADDAGRDGLSRRDERLIAIDGVNGTAVMAIAKNLAAGARRERFGISAWDASGIFGEVVVAEEAAGPPSARTLVLLYAADLAFRLRWEIRPALDEGLCVAAVPYMDTAIAFGRAAGLDADWLADVFRFAPRPGERRLVGAPAARAIAERKGFVEFGCQQMGVSHAGPPRRLVMRRTAVYLRAMAEHRAARAEQTIGRRDSWRVTATPRPGS